MCIKLGLAAKKNRKEIANLCLCLSSETIKPKLISVHNTCLNALKLCFKESILSSGVTLAKAAIGFFSLLVPTGSAGLVTQVFMNTSFENASHLARSDWIKENSSLKITVKKRLCFKANGCLKTLKSCSKADLASSLDVLDCRLT